MSLKDRHRSITVRGLVCPSEWDSEGRVRRVSIFTFDEDEYEVEALDVGRHLLDYTGREVIVRGHLAPGYRRRKVVLVRSFTVYGGDSAETVDMLAQIAETTGPVKEWM